MSSDLNVLRLFILAFAALSLFLEANADDQFKKYFFFRGSKNNYKFSGGTVSLSKTKNGAATFRSQNAFLRGYFSVSMKAPCGDSSGIVTTFFMTTGGHKQDEVDMELLGHISPNKMLLHTNVFGKGDGGKQEGFSLWFNPCEKFHEYTIWWNREHVVWLIDDIPFRVYYWNDTATNTTNPFPTRPMYIHGSIWNGSVWATQNGLIKPDFSKQPWTVQYRNFDVSRACRYYKVMHMTCNSDQTRQVWDGPLSKSAVKTSAEMRSRYLRYSYLAG